MSNFVLVDTGPLVALRDEDEGHHSLCVETLKTLPKPLLTCWPVLTEAAYLLRNFPVQVRNLLASADDQFLRVLPLRTPDIAAINAILERYEDQKLQLADAALIHLAEREGIDTIFTLDRRDFDVLRTSKGMAVKVLPS